MKAWFCLFSAFVAIELQGSIRAQDSARPIASQLVSIAVNPSYDLTKAGRSTFVATLADYCAQVLMALPTNTPAEDAWVRAEASTSDLAKIRRLVASPEYGRRALKTICGNCVESTGALKRAQTGLSRGDSAVHSESSELLRIAFDFNNDGDIVAYATHAGLSPEVWRLDFLGAVRKSLLVAALRVLEGQ